MESNSKIELNENFFAFVKKHLGEDAMRLRLKKFGDIDFPIELAIHRLRLEAAAWNGKFRFGQPTSASYFHLYSLPNNAHRKRLLNIKPILL